jgi:hypothetical protein
VKEVAVSLKNTFQIDMNARAAAMGDLTATDTWASTTAAPGFAVGFAAATAFAQDTTPLTAAETVGLVEGGYIASGHTQELSIHFPYGPTPVSVDISITVISAHGGGDIFAGYPMPDLNGSSLHGLF